MFDPVTEQARIIHAKKRDEEEEAEAQIGTWECRACGKQFSSERLVNQHINEEMTREKKRKLLKKKQEEQLRKKHAAAYYHYHRGR